MLKSERTGESLQCSLGLQHLACNVPLADPCHEMCSSVGHPVTFVLSGPMRMQEQAAALHAVGMLDYCQLKDRILIATAALVAAGSSLCYAMGGWEATEPFLAGGVGALMYQCMLQANVDSLGSTQLPKVRGLPWLTQCRGGLKALYH